MKRVISLILIVILSFFVSCTKSDNTKTKTENVDIEIHKIIAQGWGETKEKAIEDAKEDALRQFGFKVVEKDGKPDLLPAGKIVKFKVINSSSEEIEKGELWWDIEIEADVTNM